MEKSIEKIWKEGFLKGDALLAPKLNDLYNQKSKHIVEKFKRDFKINLIGIMILAAIVLVATILVGIPFVGIALFILLSGLVLIGKKEMKILNEIDKGKTSYQFIKAFHRWLNQVIKLYTKVYRIFYPLFFLSIVLGVWFSWIGEKIMQKVLDVFPDIFLVNGVPMFWFIGSLLFAVLLAFIGGEIYKLDIKIAYGYQLKKIDELLADMEELRS